MKTEIINNGTTEFPFYTVMVDGEEYCSTGDIKKANNIVNLLSIHSVSITEGLSCKCGNQTFTHRHSNWIECTSCNRIKVLQD